MLSKTFIYKELGNNGRLGNELFQIAATIGIADQFNSNFQFPEWRHQHGFKNPLPRLEDINLLSHYYTEPYFHYTPFDLNEAIQGMHYKPGNPMGINLHGYFQSEKYFAHCREKVLHYFEFSDKVREKCFGIMKNLQNTYMWAGYQFCAVHFRFGDYVNNNYYVSLQNTNYYERAISLEQITPVAERIFLIFSDDRQSAEKEIKRIIEKIGEFKYLIINNTTDIEDLCLMSMCDCHVIANSSFSWWGAYLSKSRYKTIAPKRWFGEVAKLDTKDLYTDKMFRYE